MTIVPVLNFRDFIAAEGDALTTTSMQVAAVFGRRHDNVVRAIRTLMARLPEDRRLNFEESVELRLNPSGGAAIADVSYRMTRTGFTLLAMRFTGKKALAFQLAYIDAFDAMAAYIKNQREGIQFQFLRQELEFKGRKSAVSCAAREMRSWQDEKPARLSEMNKLLHEMQPQLLPN